MIDKLRKERIDLVNWFETFMKYKLEIYIAKKGAKYGSNGWRNAGLHDLWGLLQEEISELIK